MRNFEYLKLILVVCLASLTQQSVVMTAQGAIRGEEHEGYTSYKGIPYASVNDAGRFKRAGLAPTWSGIRESQECQCTWSSRAEECLTLDVHAPAAAAPAPVLAWLRAGARLAPGKLAQQGLIVVVIAHRLGPLGFLCLDDERLPGNAGVKDAVLALRWVRDNISAFRGDPHKVVVGGQGFAAAMAEALVLAPMARGLFHGAVLQSGSALCPWAVPRDAHARALALAQLLDGAGAEADTLMRADVQHLAAKSNTMHFPYFPFAMCIEKSFKHEERLLSESPRRMLSNKFTRQVPLIIGYNSDEAYIFLSLLRKSILQGRMSRDLSMLLPEELTFTNEVELRNVVTQIRDTYFRNMSLAALLAYHRDVYFAAHVARSARLHAAAAPAVFYYRFSHAARRGVAPDHEVAKAGAAHSDELAYLFPETTRDLEGEDGVVQRHLIRLWTNFVKYLVPTPPGDPEPHWEAAAAGEPRLLDISAQLAMADGPPHSGLWDDIYDRFYYQREP